MNLEMAMLTRLTGRCVRACLSALLAVAFAAASFAQQAADKQREELVKRLRHQESLVRSARATFDIIWLPTTAENAALFRAAAEKNRFDANFDANNYILDTSFVKANSFTVRWFREGVKERLEYARYRGADSPPAAEPAVRIRVFDGNTVSSLECGAAEPFGSIGTIQSEHWKSENRTQPWSFIYEWYGRPYSDVIADCKDARLETVTRDGQTYTEVTVREQGNWLAPVLLFDRDNRMVSRKVYGKLGDQPERLWSQEELSDYQRHQGPGGEAIWFPHKEVDHHYAFVGDGKVVEWGTHAVQIRSIEFNVEIPDETFSLRFPPGTKIHDSTRPTIYSLVIGPGQWLQGKPLPALGGFGLKPASDLAAGKRIAVCFCDLQQRPSRHTVTALAAKADLWKKRGLVVVLVIPDGQVGDASANWLKDHKAPFIVGRLPADEDTVRRILADWGATAMPHIVLTDVSHVVAAEAISPQELENCLKGENSSPPSSKEQ